MILQALYDYYQRKVAHGSLPRYGFASRPIHFCIVISNQGELVGVRRLSGDPKNPAKELNVPTLLSRRSVNIEPNFLWDNTGYVFGCDDKGNPGRAKNQRDAFVRLHEEILTTCPHHGLRALLNFLTSYGPEQASQLKDWPDMCGKNVVFQLEHENAYLHDDPALQTAWVNYLTQHSQETRAYCLVTGQFTAVAKLHPAVRGVAGAQTTGAGLSNFNLKAFCSYGKEQNLNAPVSVEVAFAYTTALNYLLRHGSSQLVRLADTSVVFWTQRDSPLEGFFRIFLNPTDDPADLQQVRTLLDATRSGAWPTGYDPSVPCYILGLAPNASRLAVRFWYAGSAADLLSRLRSHFDDLSIVHKSNEPDFPRLHALLCQTAVQEEAENIPPLLAGALLRAILTGAEYPLAFYTAILRRINADHTIKYFRAAALKAYLVRHYRRNNQPKEVPMALDPSNKNPGYLLGRLFALLEKAQLDALGKVDTTIKDRFYGAASATPRAVFPILMRLAQHHLAKAEYGAARDRDIEAVVSQLQEFPAHLSLEDQGMFAIGYYHQRHAFYNKSNE
ncbi:MAG: type I-C CRISPR-associated protein Cas8c/Csd1 [bacterium]|nr:type I-C CRISPR-associated protein Cas8c/Csd1 [bacterium]